MSIGAEDVLARKKVESGLLKGKILSEQVIRVQSPKVIWTEMGFVIQQDRKPECERFKKFCETEIDLGFREKQRFLPATYSFVHSCYRGLPEYGAMLAELVYQSEPEVYFSVDAKGHWDASKFKDGREGQAKFDVMHGASVEKAYRIRHYDLVITLFKDKEAGKLFMSRYTGFGDNHTALLQRQSADTTILSQRIPEKWFSAKINMWVPVEFAMQLDDDAIDLLFGPGTLQKMGGKKAGVPKMHPQDKQIVVDEVRRFYGRFMHWDGDDELLKLHSEVDNRTDVQVWREYAISVRMKCDLTITVRKPK